MDDGCPLHILFVEDLPADGELAERELRRSGISFLALRVETKEEFFKALYEFKPDLVISDYALPEFDGMEALKLSLSHDPVLPFIVLTGSMNESTAVACMRAGATDYVLKDHIARLPFAVRDALEQGKARLRKEAAERELRQSEERLKRSEERYRNIFTNALEGIFQATPEGRYLTANPALARMFGYASPEELIEAVTDITGQIYVDPAKRGEFIVLLEQKGEVAGFDSEFKRKDGSAFWASMSARAVRDETGRLLYIEGMAEDITKRKETEEKLRETMASLRKAIGATIQVMMSAVEVRDPYTAGHQKRVVNLARAIATEMGLPRDMIDGIRMAGAIHDIGKISVPAEILSKPTKLSAIEFNLIKTHAQSGYEMLQKVDSPWPLAQIVHQHHERMNGSGYPNGLKGDEILLGARVIAVADVVESMASYRPYRPALGIDAALAEIEQNRGTLYDPAVVDHCLRLFREKGFKFE